ncbi:MAG: O-antigen ligase family protein [Gaiellales bacterium]
MRPLPRLSPTAAVLLAAPAMVLALWGVFFGAGGIAPGAAELIAASTALPAAVALGLMAVGRWPFSLPNRATLVAAAGLALFAVVAALSGFWSLSPAQSVSTAILSSGYLGALALGLLLGPALRRPGVVFATGLTAVATVASAWALIARSFSATTGVQLSPRLSGTLTLPNALAVLALAGVFGGLALAAHRDVRLRALGGAIAAVNALALVLTSSRSGLGLTAIGVVILLLVLPTPPRMRLAGLIAIIPAIALGFRAARRTAFTAPEQSVQPAGWQLIVSTVIAVVLGAAIAAVFHRVMPGNDPDGAPRRATRRTLLIAVGGVLLLAIAVIVRSGGIHGTINAIRAGFTSPVGQAGVRVGIGSNYRDHWWATAWDGFKQEPWHGWGAGTFRLLEQITQNPTQVTDSAHNTILEVLAGAGLLGGIPFIVGGIALVVMAVAGIRRPRADDAIGAAVIAMAAIGFLAQGFIDVDWSLAAEGIIVYAAIGAIAPADQQQTRITLPWRLITGVLCVGLVAAGLLGIPFWLSARQTVESQDRIVDNPTSALQLAASAHRFNPLAVPPLLAEADAYEALGDHASARAALEEAIRHEPRNYEAWLQYGTYLAFSWGDENAGRSALMWAARLSGDDESVHVVLDALPVPAP